MTDFHFPIGPVSEGTLCVDDLFKAFDVDARKMVAAFLERAGQDPKPFIAALDEAAGPWLDAETDEDAQDVVDALCAVLDDFAMEWGAMFGTHEGDGACFGFWPILPDLLDSDDDDLGLYAVNDHGNVAYHDHAGNVIWAVV